MTNKDKYKQAFSVLHASRDMDLEVLMMKKEKNKKNIIKKMSVAIAGLAFLFVGSNGIAYAATGSTWVSKVINFTTGNGTDVEIVQEDNSLSYQISREGDNNYVSVQDGKLYFVFDDIKEDVTEKCSEENYYKYEYTDEQKMRHVILIGGTPDAAGWAELIFDENGEYLFNQMNVGTDDAEEEPAWLLKGMHDQGVETGNPEYDNKESGNMTTENPEYDNK